VAIAAAIHVSYLLAGNNDPKKKKNSKNLKRKTNKAAAAALSGYFSNMITDYRMVTNSFAFTIPVSFLFLIE